LLALDSLWHTAELAGLPELDARSNFLRLIFAVGFARLGARGLAQELGAPIELELDVHEPCNRALFRLYMARLAHEASGGNAEAWAAEVARSIEAVRDPKQRQAVQWLQRRSLWLRLDEDAATDDAAGRLALPPGLESAGLAEHLARELSPGSGHYDYEVAEARRPVRAAGRSPAAATRSSRRCWPAPSPASRASRSSATAPRRSPPASTAPPASATT
jgi:hypothetical protein